MLARSPSGISAARHYESVVARSQVRVPSMDLFSASLARSRLRYRSGLPLEAWLAWQLSSV